MRTELQDLRLALRTMRKQPLFSAVAVVILGLGIGANTAIFSVVQAVLLAPAPYPARNPDDVLVIDEKSSHGRMTVAHPNFKDWQRLNQSFEAMGGYRDTEYNLSGLEEPMRLSVRQVSYNHFGILGVSPLHGRLFVPEEDRPGAARSLVLNHQLWRSRFGGDPGVVGRTVRVDDQPYTIVGVLPEDFEPIPRERAYAALEPWADNEGSRDRGNHMGIHVLARMREGLSLDEARVEMETIAARLEAQYPATNSGVSVLMTRLSDARVADFRPTLLMLLGATTLVLLIACANVAHLFLARAARRKRDAAIRAALGAGRIRLARQGLAEALVLSGLGCGVGIGLAFFGLEALRALLPPGVPRLDEVELSSPVLAYSLALSFLTALAFGVAPGLLTSRAKPSDALKEGSRDTGGRLRAGRGLLVAEVALATVLLIGANLLIRSVYNLSRVDPGFRADHLLTMKVGLPSPRYEGEKRRVFLREMNGRLASLPGVRDATVGLSLPLLGSSWSSVFIVGEQPVPERADLPVSHFTPIAPGYIETFGIPLLEGRTFTATDATDAPRVVLVNRKLAERFWPGESAIGKRLKQGWPEDSGEWSPWREVVGVVGDIKQNGLAEETGLQTYIPLDQYPLWDVNIALRTDGDPMALAGAAKSAIAAMDGDVPVYQVETMDRVMASSIAPRRFTMILLGLFAALALGLAAIGLYGVVAYSVAGRTREIGLRMSVGAARPDIFRLVVRQGMGCALAGAGIGIAAATGASQLLSSFLYGVAPRDPLTFAVVPLALLAVAFGASAAPALQASRIDPIRALRHD